jgi:hypothetical protein
MDIARNTKTTTKINRNIHQQDKNTQKQNNITIPKGEK